MKRIVQTLPARTRWELFVSAALVIGIVIASVVPGPGRRAAVATAFSLFHLAEGDSLQPLFASPRAIHALNAQTGGIAEFAGYDEYQVCLRVGDTLTTVDAVRFTGRFLGFAGIEFVLKEGTHSSEQRVFISENFWERTYGRDASVLGRPLNVNGREFRIAGVTRRARTIGQQADLWMPVYSRVLGEGISLKVMGAMKPGEEVSRKRKELLRKCNSAQIRALAVNAAALRFLPLEPGIRFTESEQPLIAGPQPGSIATSGRTG